MQQTTESSFNNVIWQTSLKIMIMIIIMFAMILSINGSQLAKIKQSKFLTFFGIKAHLLELNFNYFVLFVKVCRGLLPLIGKVWTTYSLSNLWTNGWKDIAFIPPRNSAPRLGRCYNFFPLKPPYAPEVTTAPYGWRAMQLIPSLLSLCTGTRGWKYLNNLSPWHLYQRLAITK